jgi:hypothetical protein
MQAYGTFHDVPADTRLVFDQSMLTDEHLESETRDGPWVTFVDTTSHTGYRYLCTELLQHWANQLFAVHDVHMMVVELPLIPSPPLLPHTNTEVSPANILVVLASFFRHEEWYEDPRAGLILAEMCLMAHVKDREALTFFITEVLWFFYTHTIGKGGLLQRLFTRKRPLFTVHTEGATTPLSLQTCMVTVWQWLTSLCRKSSRDYMTPLQLEFAIPFRWLKKHKDWCPFYTHAPLCYTQFMSLHTTFAPLLALTHQAEASVARAAPLAWSSLRLDPFESIDRDIVARGIARTLTLLLAESLHSDAYILLFNAGSYSEAKIDQWRWDSSQHGGRVHSCYRDTLSGMTGLLCVRDMTCPYPRQIDYFTDVAQFPDLLYAAQRTGLAVVGLCVPQYASLYLRPPLVTEGLPTIVHYWLNRDVILRMWEEGMEGMLGGMLEELKG